MHDDEKADPGAVDEETKCHPKDAKRQAEER